jgi:hypothetical protein
MDDTMDNTPVKVLTATQAIRKMEEIPEIKSMPEFAAIQAAIKKDIIALGIDEAFALRDENGNIRAFRQWVKLSLEDKTLTQPVPGGDIVVSAQGYEVWAEGAGANVIFPDTVLVGSSHQPNPHAIMDEHNGRIKLVYARAVAFRFSSKGIPQVCDWTTIFDTAAYRMIDLIGKAKKFPQAFRLLPTGMEPPAEEGTWGKYIFDEAMTLWVNSAHGEALQWYGQIINREKKSIDFAQTFARRNALKHLSGIQRAPGPYWEVPVLCWRPTSGNIVKWDATQYAQLQQRVGKLIHSADKEFGGNQQQCVKTIMGREDVADDQDGNTSIIDTEMDPEDQQQQTQQTHQNGSTDQTKEQKPASGFSADEEVKILNSLNVIRTDPEMRPLFVEACKKLGVPHGGGFDAVTAKKVLDALEGGM